MEQNRNTSQQDNDQNEESGRKHLEPRRVAFYWIAIIGGIILISLLIWPEPGDEVEVSFSSLERQVEAGNVEEIHLTGKEASGEFRESVTVVDGRVYGPEDGVPDDVGEDDMVEAPAFESTIPDGGESEFLALLRDQNVEITAEEPSDGFLGGISGWWLLLILGMPFLLFIGLALMMSRAAGGGQQQFMRFTQTKARVSDASRPKTVFDDVAGENQAKSELMQVVDFLKSPEKFHKLGAELPRGTLLAGPPGTGKTLLARAVAGEAGVPFFSMSASEFVEMFVGVGASRVRDLFKNAKESSPAIIFIDELDAVGRQRFAGVGSGNDEREQTLNQILDEMDGFEAHDDVIVLAATNRPDVLDPALIRPGRFDRQVTLGLPDRRARRDILGVHARKIVMGEDVDLDEIAQSTPGFSGADLSNLINESALVAAMKEKEQVNQDDIMEALERIVLGAERPMVLSDEDKRLIAYHEAGHAIVAWHTPEADPLRMVSIIPRGHSLGATLQAPADDRFNYSREYLIGRLAILMGGRAAEQLFLDKATTGAQNDLKEATRLARRMVGLWGMSDRIGPYYLGLDEEHIFLGREMAQERSISEELLNRAETVAQGMVGESMDVARNLLQEQREDVERLVERLLEQETVTSEEIGEILRKPAETGQAEPTPGTTSED